MNHETNPSRISRRCFLKSTSLALMAGPAFMRAGIADATEDVKSYGGQAEVPQCPENAQVGSGDYLRIGHMCGNIF